MIRSPRARSAVVVTLVALAGAAGCSSSARPASTSGASSTSTTGNPAGGTGASPDGFTVDRVPALVRKVEPMVVTVITDQGEGSGIIWSAAGTVVTNNHVISGARSVMVEFADGKRVSAKVRAADAYSDIAVLDTARSGVPAARWANAQPAVGTFVVAVGSPLGLTNSATTGVISGTNRNIPNGGGAPLVDLLQTDAAISPGNSGGALVDDRGTVVGMTEAYLPPSTGAVSIGLAIPSTIVTDTVRQLLATGKVQHAYLGVSAATITPDIARQLGVSAATGVIVEQVVANSPAAAAGLQPGDVLTKLDAMPLRTSDDLVAALRVHRPGDEVTLTYERNGAAKTATLRLGSRSG